MAKTSLTATALFVVTVFSGYVSSQDVSEEPNEDVANSNLDFTNSLYKELSREEGNVFFSPLSIQTILALTAQAARGTTASEMKRGLKLPQDNQVTKDGFRQLMSSLRQNSDVTLKIANNIFFDKTFPVEPKFTNIAKDDFFADSQLVNFKETPNNARLAINNWVENNTNQMIKNLLPEESVNSDTTMVLVNAIYFKGNWKTQFDPNRTKPQRFSVSADVTQEVPTMHMTSFGDFHYKDSSVLDAQVLEIPYVGSNVSLLILLPKTKNGIANLETKLANIPFRNITTRGMTRPIVHLSLPKFKVEKSLDMKEVLKTMGMPTMFTGAADFTGVTSVPLQISKVVHKAFMEVNEEGTEATGATGILSSSRSSRVNPEITFNVDHPFIFALTTTTPHNRYKKTILFMGRYSHP